MTAFPALVNEADTLASHYRDIPLKELQSKEISGQAWTEVKSLSDELKNKEILIRGHAQTIRAVSKNMAFIIVRERGSLCNMFSLLLQGLSLNRWLNSVLMVGA
ncbi:hypothetical protein AMTRI_Chr09g19930 [Amborella trichopoda]